MKTHKRLMQSLRDIEENNKKERVKSWLKTQCGSVKRGYERGLILPPKHLRGFVSIAVAGAIFIGGVLVVPLLVWGWKTQHEFPQGMEDNNRWQEQP
jgi:hypothetical protein